jgi:hypothetical protein
MREDLKTLKVKQDSGKVPTLEWVTYATIVALMLGMLYTLYTLTLNVALASHQRQIEYHIIHFLNSGTKNKEVTVNFLFFKKSISLSREGRNLNVDLGSDDNFNKHCIDTNFKLLSEKARKEKNFFDEINSKCAELEGKSAFSVRLNSPSSE